MKLSGWIQLAVVVTLIGAVALDAHAQDRGNAERGSATSSYRQHREETSDFLRPKFLEDRDLDQMGKSPEDLLEEDCGCKPDPLAELMTSE
jgi:hypothetical protein